MPYATPPMGDYKTYGYAGDPGWLSAAFAIGKAFFKKKLKKEIMRPIMKIAGGGVIGAAATQLLTPPALPLPPGGIGGQITMPGGVGVGFQYQPFVGPTRGGLIPGTAGGCPTGYHLRKDQRLPPKCVRNRRMNIGNARALRRAMRRSQGFEKLAKRVISFHKRVRIK